MTIDYRRFLIEHAAASSLVWVAASAYGGSPAHGGIASTMYRAFFSPAHVGSATAGTSAMADTIYAMSVYAEPFVAAGRLLSYAAVPAIIVGGSAFIAHKVQTDPSWQARARDLGRTIDLSPHVSG